MTDLEIVKRCAEKMGLMIVNHGVWGERITDGHSNEIKYDPLTDDAQAMALVKKFELALEFHSHQGWRVSFWNGDAWMDGTITPDLNRAICECVARLP